MFMASKTFNTLIEHSPVNDKETTLSLKDIYVLMSFIKCDISMLSRRSNVGHLEPAMDP